MTWRARYREKREESDRLEKERHFWKNMLRFRIEDEIADPTGAVSGKEIDDKMCKYEKELKLYLEGE